VLAPVAVVAVSRLPAESRSKVVVVPFWVIVFGRSSW
jgi:hypothetical protein